MEGSLVGPYRVIAKLGQGGMGAVYSAENSKTGLTVVLKILLRQHTRDKELLWRFFNEAKTASQLDHDNIVAVYDAGRMDDGTAYIAMEYLAGQTLGELLDKQQTLSVAAGAYVCWCMAKALEAAHSEGIIHRDLKPDNIHIVPDDAAPHGFRVKLLDFGIAKLMWDNTSSERTATGVMLGTPAYMAPEQCRSLRSIDGRADLYALGCILYEVLTSTPPFVAEGGGELLALHVTQHPPRLRKRDPKILATSKNSDSRCSPKIQQIGPRPLPRWRRACCHLPSWRNTRLSPNERKSQASRSPLATTRRGSPQNLSIRQNLPSSKTSGARGQPQPKRKPRWLACAVLPPPSATRRCASRRSRCSCLSSA
ncbi:MAG: protein kinase [Myxococcales bacterium]|nr:protein kinase [Myxococcales bacterium]